MEAHEFKGVAQYLGAGADELALLLEESVDDIRVWLEGDDDVPREAGDMLRLYASAVRSAVMGMKEECIKDGTKPMVILVENYENSKLFNKGRGVREHGVNVILTKRIGELVHAEIIRFELSSFKDFAKEQSVDFDEIGLMMWAVEQVS